MPVTDYFYECIVYTVFYLNILAVMSFFGYGVWRCVYSQYRRIIDAYDRLDKHLSSINGEMSTLNYTMSNVNSNLGKLNHTGQQIIDTADSALGYQVTRDVISSVRYVCERVDVINLAKSYLSPYINFFSGFPLKIVVPPTVVQPTHNVGSMTMTFMGGRPQTDSESSSSSSSSTPISPPAQTLDSRFKKLAQITDKLLNEAAIRHGVMETPESNEKTVSNHVSRQSSPDKAKDADSTPVSRQPSPNKVPNAAEAPVSRQSSPNKVPNAAHPDAAHPDAAQPDATHPDAAHPDGDNQEATGTPDQPTN